MSRSLPLKAHLRQLKHQAKDVMRAHAEKLPAALSTLRRLRQFADKTDEQVFAAELALNEVHYALALEYGFSSWAALKAHVEESRFESVGRAQRSGDSVVIGGFEREAWGGRHGRQNSVIAALQVALGAAGCAVSYAELMGFGGAAFRLQHKWCPSSPHSECGFNCSAPALRALGSELVWFKAKDWRSGADAEGLSALHEAATASIDAGIPVLLSSEECSLMVGYADSGERIVRRYASDDLGYERTNELPWDVAVLRLGDARPDVRDRALEALERAVMLAHTESFAEYASGFAAFECWANELEQDERFEGLEGEKFFAVSLGNAHTLQSLADARVAADEFLVALAPSLPETARGHVLAAADAYAGAARAILEPDDEAVQPFRLFPWMLGSPGAWTQRARLAQARSLRKALQLERRAVTELERALEQVKLA